MWHPFMGDNFLDQDHLVNLKLVRFLKSDHYYRTINIYELFHYGN